MTINDEEAVDVLGDEYWQSTSSIKDVVFNIMFSGITSLNGIAIELNRQGHWGKEWKPVDVKRLLAGE